MKKTKTFNEVLDVIALFFTINVNHIIPAAGCVEPEVSSAQRDGRGLQISVHVSVSDILTMTGG